MDKRPANNGRAVASRINPGRLQAVAVLAGIELIHLIRIGQFMMEGCDGDYVLVAIAAGIILQFMLAN